MTTLQLGDGRNELKFVAPEILLPHVRTWLMLHPVGFSTAYPDRRVNSLYFDSWDRRALEENLSGASRRTKVRYRWYGPTDVVDRGQLEVKLKRNKLGKKLTYEVSQAPGGCEWNEIVADLRAGLPPEGRKWLDPHVQPMLLVSYDRTYLEDASGRLRVTIDHDVRYFDQRYGRRPNVGRAARVDGELVVELKCARDDIRYARHCLASFPISVSRNSKYSIGSAAVRGY